MYQSQPKGLERPTEYSQGPGIQPHRSAAETLKKWLGSSGGAKESGGLRMLLSLLDLNIRAFLPQVVWKRPKFEEESYSRYLGEIPPTLQAWLLPTDQTFRELGS